MLGLTFWRGEKSKEKEEEEEEGEGEEVQKKKFRYVFALESWVFGLLRFGMENYLLLWSRFCGKIT